MAVYLGTSSLAACYVGSTAVQKIYVGSTEVWSADAPVSYIDANTSTTTSVSIPTHQANDVILIWALSAWGIGTAPSMPSAGGTVPTFTSIRSGTHGAGGYRLAYATASASGRTSGTWTGAAAMLVAVLRGANASPVGGSAIDGTYGGTPTAPAVTLTNSSGSSMLLHFYGSWGSPTWGTAPSGYTRRIANNTAGLVLNTKDSTTSDGSIGQSMTGGYGWWAASSVEILN